jgi:hypothetical protein
MRHRIGLRFKILLFHYFERFRRLALQYFAVDGGGIAQPAFSRITAISLPAIRENAPA